MERMECGGLVSSTCSDKRQTVDIQRGCCRKSIIKCAVDQLCNERKRSVRNKRELSQKKQVGENHYASALWVVSMVSIVQ